ncbi:MAG: hypothetical protein V3U72_02730 [Candidatus Aenigmarchaeota archaeon]
MTSRLLNTKDLREYNNKKKNTVYIPHLDLFVYLDYVRGDDDKVLTGFTQSDFMGTAKKLGRELLSYREITEAVNYAAQNPKNEKYRKLLESEFKKIFRYTSTNLRFMEELPDGNGYKVEWLDGGKKAGPVIEIAKKGFILDRKREKDSRLPGPGGTIENFEHFMKEAHNIDLRKGDMNVSELLKYLKKNPVEFWNAFVHEELPEKNEKRVVVRSGAQSANISIPDIEETKRIENIKSDALHGPDYSGTLTARFGKHVQILKINRE